MNVCNEDLMEFQVVDYLVLLIHGTQYHKSLSHFVIYETLHPKDFPFQV